MPRGFRLRTPVTANRQPLCQQAEIMRLTIPAFLVVLLFAPAGRAAADEHSPLLTLYLAQGADPDILSIFPELLRGASVTEDTYFLALGYFQPLATPGGLQRLFELLRVPNTRTGVEGLAGKHFGLQYNVEVGAAWQLRFAPLRLARLRVRPAVGIGLSYAIGNPAYEDGPRSNPDKRYHLLNFNSYELEWSLEPLPAIALVTRIHHRSGIWGVIAPPIVGSNFLSVGLRYRF
jgi:hypothetical protein